MTKEKLQQEIKEKVKEGVKPSETQSVVGDQIKRLKRSKSTGDISVNPELATLKAENEELKKKIQELETRNIENISVVGDQNKEIFVDAAEESPAELKVKISELETKLSETQTELDKANEARLNALKDFDKQQEKIKKLEQELESTSKYGSEQIVKLEKINQDLRREKGSLSEQLKLAKQDLSNYQRINELRLGKKEVSDG